MNSILILSLIVAVLGLIFMFCLHLRDKKSIKKLLVISSWKMSYSADSWMTVLYDSKLNVMQVTNPMPIFHFKQGDQSLKGLNASQLETLVVDEDADNARLLFENLKTTRDNKTGAYFECLASKNDDDIFSIVTITEYLVDDNIVSHSFIINHQMLLSGPRRSTEYVMDFSLEGMSVGAYVRVYLSDGTSKYMSFNSNVKSLFESQAVTDSSLWNQQRDDDEDKLLLADGTDMEFNHKIEIDNRPALYFKVMKRKMVSNIGLTYIVSTVIDATELKRKQWESEDALLNLNLAVDSMNALVWYYNTSSCEFTFYDSNMQEKSMLPFENAIKYLHPDSRESFCNYFSIFINGDVDKETSVWKVLNGRKGTYEYVENRMALMRRNDGTVKRVVGIQINITDRQNKELEMQSMLSGLNMAMQSGHITVWDYDVSSNTYNILYGNAEHPGLTEEGYDVSYVHPDYVERYKAYLKSLLSSGDCNHKIVVRMNTDDPDDMVYCEMTATVIRNEVGRPVRIVGTKKDITDIYRDQYELMNKTAILDAIMNSVNIGVEVHDVDGNILQVNQYDMKIFGVDKPEDLMVKERNFQTSPNIPDDVKQQIHADGNFTVYFEYDFDSVRQHGTFKTNRKGKAMLELKSAPLITTDGSNKGYVLVVSDVTDNFMLNKRFEHLYRNQNLMLEAMPIGIEIFDKDGTLIFNNRSAVELFGRTHDALGHWNMYDNPNIREEIKEKYRHGESVVDNCVLDFSKVNKSGLYHTDKKGISYLTVRTNVIKDENGNIDSYISNITDDTQMVKAHRELEIARDKAEAANRLKSAFMANMSHEIRTPLNAIIGFSELLVENDNKDENREFQHIITTNGEILLNLINDILDLSKLEAGYLEWIPIEFDVSDMMDEIFKTFEIRVTNEVTLKKEIPFEHYVIDSDRKRIFQIVTNFTSNAVKFTTRGSIELGYKVYDGGVEFYVTDTGIGIQDVNKSRVFGRFEQFNPFAQGTGLGLAICKALVDSQNGKIWFESNYGVGSTFHAWIPCKQVK